MNINQHEWLIKILKKETGFPDKDWSKKEEIWSFKEYTHEYIFDTTDLD